MSEQKFMEPVTYFDQDKTPAEFNARLVQAGSTQQRRATQQGEGQPPPSPGYVVSDDGGSYLFVQNTKERKKAPRAAAAVGTEQLYAVPQPYWEVGE